MLERIYTLEDAFRCCQLESTYRHFLQPSLPYLSQIGTLYTPFKAFRAASYVYRNNVFSTIPYFAIEQIKPQSLLPTQIAATVKKMAAEAFRKGSKLITALPSGFESIYFEFQIVLEIKLCPMASPPSSVFL